MALLIANLILSQRLLKCLLILFPLGVWCVISTYENIKLQARTEVEGRAVELEGDDAEHRRPTEALVKVPAISYQASVI